MGNGGKKEFFNKSEIERSSSDLACVKSHSFVKFLKQ